MITKVKICAFIVFYFLNFTSMAQQKTVSRRHLMQVIIQQNLGNIEAQEITVSGGQQVPKHLHPCSVVGYIKSGEVFFQIEGEEGKILKEGEAFYEPKNKVILHFDNASKKNHLIFVAFYLKEGSEENIKILQ